MGGLSDSWRHVFIHAEGLFVNVVVTSMTVMAMPNYSLKAYAAGFASDPALDHPLLSVLWRSWGYLIVAYGLVEVSVLTCASARCIATVLMSCIVGDLLHLFLFVPFNQQLGVWDAAAVGGAGEAAAIFLCRCVWLATHFHVWRKPAAPTVFWGSLSWPQRLIFAMQPAWNALYVIGLTHDSKGFLQIYAPGFEEDLLVHPVTHLLAVSWGYMIAVMGLVELSVLSYGSPRAIAGLFASLCAGEVMHALFFFPFLASHQDGSVLRPAAVAGLALTAATFALRCAWLRRWFATRA